MNPCTKHPRYHAKSAPRSRCSHCWTIFLSAKPASTSKPQTAREVLDFIKEFLNRDPADYGSPVHSEQRRLWKVLTAIRGPDEGALTQKTEDIKKATTAIIRLHAFGNCRSQTGAIINADSEGLLKLRNSSCRNNDLGYHFWTHIHQAFDALGLDIEKVNK